MAMKPKTKKVYRSMQGKIVDIDKLIKRNELTPAVGNAKVNARGDELGPGGKIIRKREEVVRDYYDGNRPVADEVPTKSTESLSSAEAAQIAEFDDEPVPPKPAPKPAPKPVQKKAVPKDLEEAIEEVTVEDDWIEDEEGNFVKKGN